MLTSYPHYNTSYNRKMKHTFINNMKEEINSHICISLSFMDIILIKTYSKQTAN